MPTPHLVLKKGDRVITPHGLGTISSFRKVHLRRSVYVCLDTPMDRSLSAYIEELVQPTVSTEIIHAIRVREGGPG